jgi:hypothetical protein
MYVQGSVLQTHILFGLLLAGADAPSQQPVVPADAVGDAECLGISIPVDIVCHWTSMVRFRCNNVVWIVVDMFFRTDASILSAAVASIVCACAHGPSN